MIMPTATTVRTRTAGSMKAISSAAPRRSGWSRTAWALKLLAVLIAVTGVGLVAGAFIVSPVVTQEERIIAVSALGALMLFALVARGIVVLISGLRNALRVRHQRNRRAAAVPVLGNRSSRSTRTPRAVRVLAAEGVAPIEIASKTGLSVDAVAMLLKLGGPAAVAR